MFSLPGPLLYPYTGILVMRGTLYSAKQSASQRFTTSNFSFLKVLTFQGNCDSYFTLACSEHVPAGIMIAAALTFSECFFFSPSVTSTTRYKDVPSNIRRTIVRSLSYDGSWLKLAHNLGKLNIDRYTFFECLIGAGTPLFA